MSPARAQRPPLATAQKVLVLLVPWLFVVVFAVVVQQVLLPRLISGSIGADVLTILIGSSFICFVVAAITVSRDTLAGRFPE